MAAVNGNNNIKILAPQSISFVLAGLSLLCSNYREVSSQLANQPANLANYREILDPSINLSLQWTIIKNDNSIIFSVEASTRQIIIGLTNRRQVNGSDIIVCGVDGNGAPYVYDMYGVNNNTVNLDSRQDWRLISGSASINHIQIQIQRNLDTCDEQDVAVNGNAIEVIWDWNGRNDQSQPTQIDPKGLKIIYFLHPYILPVSSNFNPESQVRVSRTFTIPPKRTTYWCSIHKLNVTFRRPHHIYGFSPFFGNEDARRHVHHQLLYRCYPPAPGIIDIASIFEPFINHPGEECYLNNGPRLPSTWCREKVHIFAIGGEPVQLPDSVGITIGETSTQYFMLETHYDNPESRANLTIENGVDLQYSSRRRPNDGSIIFVGGGVLGTFIVPPMTPSFNVVGHCSQDCLAKMVPAGGAEILGVSLHAHMSARIMRLRHFRSTTESWVITDDDYRFNYQQIRFLQNPFTILPGDKLTMECTYDSTWRNGSAVLSGFSTSDEMCMAFLVLNKQVPFLFCSSEYPTQRTMNRYGIQNMTWDVDSAERVINVANNPNLVGVRLSQIVENQTWTPATVRQLEEEQKYGGHTTSCPNTRVVGALAYYAMQLTQVSGGLIQLPLMDQSVPTSRSVDSPFPGLLPVTYPTLIPPYVPPETCPPRNEVGSSSTTAATTGTPSAVTLDIKSTIAPHTENIIAAPTINYSHRNVASTSDAELRSDPIKSDTRVLFRISNSKRVNSDPELTPSNSNAKSILPVASVNMFLNPR